MTARLNKLPEHSPSEVIEDFFSKYPSEQANYLLWKWFIRTGKLYIKDMDNEETVQFAEFFESLQGLIHAVAAGHPGDNLMEGS